jgi:hypothetical protein
MGCGCGGRKNNSRPSAVGPIPSGGVNARSVAPQAGARQALAKAARERLEQNSTNAQRNALGGKDDIEKRKRILISLRKRKPQG